MKTEHTPKRKIGFKLFILMTLLVLFGITPLIYVVFSTISYFGNYSVSVNKAQIKEQAYSYLQTIARDRTEKYEAFLSRAAIASSMMAAAAQEIYDNKKYYRQVSSDGSVRMSSRRLCLSRSGSLPHSRATVSLAWMILPSPSTTSR